MDKGPKRASCLSGLLPDMTLQKGDTLLRPFRQTDIPLLMRLRNDVPLQAQLLARVRGSDEMQVRRWLLNRTSVPGRAFLIIADATTHAPLGFIQVADIDDFDRRGELGLALVTDAQGVGHGGRAITIMLDHLHTTRGLRKMTLRVRADNQNAIRCYERVGFRHCGVLHSHSLFDGVWYDVLLMELLLSMDL